MQNLQVGLEVLLKEQWERNNKQTLLGWGSSGAQQFQTQQLQFFLSGLTFEEIGSLVEGQHPLILAQANSEHGNKT